VTTFRPDSSTLLAPFVDVLSPLLNESEVGLRSAGIYVLGRSRSPQALSYLAAHLNDDNSAEVATLIAAPLLESRDSDNIHKVLTVVQKRPEWGLKGGVIQMLGFYRITVAESLSLLRSGLNDANSDIRIASLNAVANMPKDTRSLFTAELQRLGNLDQVPEIRSRATQVLISSNP
jgi:HEAT repeat protein